MLLYQGTFSYVYPRIIKDLFNYNSKPIKTRGKAIHKKLHNILIQLDASSQEYVFSKSRMTSPYSVGELIWYLSGSDSLAFIEKFFRAYKYFSDDGKTVRGAYGKRFDGKFEKIISLLQKDKFSRRGVINIYDSNLDLGVDTKDVPCNSLLQVQFIDDDHLAINVYSRSSDVITGLPIDVVQFQAIAMMLARHFSHSKPIKISLFYFISNLHLYETDLLIAEKIKDESFDSYRITYNTPLLEAIDLSKEFVSLTLSGKIGKEFLIKVKDESLKRMFKVALYKLKKIKLEEVEEPWTSMIIHFKSTIKAKKS